MWIRILVRVLCALWVGQAASVRAESAPLASEVTVTGTAAALLSVDGKPVGRLPLPGPLTLPGGPHRFLLEEKNYRYESDVLAIPAGRVAQLSLTRGTKGSAITVLSLTPMILLAVRGEAIDESLRQALHRAAQEGVRTEHAVLVPTERVAATKSGQTPACLARLDCLLQVALELEARMVLVVDLPAPSEPEKGSVRCGMHGELLDVSTGQIAAKAETEPACLPGEDQILESLVRMARRLLSEATDAGKGTLLVTTSPTGARVLVDGRPRGVTSWQGPSVAGQREVLVEKEGYQPQRAVVTVKTGMSVTLPIELVPLVVATAMVSGQERSSHPILTQPFPPPPGRSGSRTPRPRWRILTGGIAAGIGLLTAAFGVSALTQNGHCADIPPSTSGYCGEVLATTGIGAGLLAAGLSVAAGGVLLSTLPGPRSMERTAQ